MTNVAKVILGAAIAAASIATPALAAHKSKQISAHHNGYVARSSQRSGIHTFASAPRWSYPADDRTTPFSGGGN